MGMKKRPVVMLGAILIAGSGAIAVPGATAFATFNNPAQEASAASDPRQEPPVVRLATAARVSGSERSFTGIIGARVESNLGFRVPGKIAERLGNVGQRAKDGQPLMRARQAGPRPRL